MAASIPYEALAPIPAGAVSQDHSSTTIWHGLSLGVERGGLLVVSFIGGLSMMEFESSLGRAVDFVIGFLLIAALYSGLKALVGLLWRLICWLLQRVGEKVTSRLPADKAARVLAPYRLASSIRGQSLGAVIAPLAIMLMGKIKMGEASMFSLPAVIQSLIPFGIIAAALAGIAIAGRVKRREKIVLLAMAGVIVAIPVAWYIWPGTVDYLARPDTEALSALPEFTFENPGLPGPYNVQTLRYGSGQTRRSEFGKRAALITATVNPSTAYIGWTGTAGGFYKWLFGFDFSHLPLDGKVWYPEGNGPFPIVLIVHGNHNAADYSDPGYAYLGQHFASRGFITVSVDQNFLNGDAMWEGSGNEMPIRAWLLLKHLQVWREWNQTPGNPFFGKVDLGRVVLMGHSRGGEAVAHAAMLNTQLDNPLTNLSEDGEFGFGIRGVVAIAPAEGQWKPSTLERKIVDVSYMLIQGGHDQDLSSLSGIRQYNRVSFEANPDSFKAVAYIYRANHGNFNTVWGDDDHGTSASMILNRAGLLNGEEQRTTARVFMTAFLEATVNDKAEYRKVFITPAGARNWLPEDIYVTQYEDASFQAVNRHDRTGQAETADMLEAKVEFGGLEAPSRPGMALRDGQLQQNRALLAVWQASSNPTYSLTLPAGSDANFVLDGNERLAFQLANAGEASTPIYVTVEMIDANGKVAVQPVNRFGVIPPLTPATLEKSQQISRLLGYDFFPKIKAPYERVLQSFEIPLSAFRAANPEFDATKLSTIRFRFNDENPGKVYVDEIGFRG